MVANKPCGHGVLHVMHPIFIRRDGYCSTNFHGLNKRFDVSARVPLWEFSGRFWWWLGCFVNGVAVLHSIFSGDDVLAFHLF